MIDLKKEIHLSDLVRKTAKTNKQHKRPVTGPARKRGRAFGGKTASGELVGVKLGATQIAAARVMNGGPEPKLLQLARQPLPPGIVADGEVTDVAALAAGLQEFFSVNALPRKNVRLGLATNHVGVRSFEIAGIDDERQLANAVLFRAHEVVSIPVEEAVIDYRVIGEEVDESGSVNRRILLVAAYREPIERFRAAFREAGIGLVGVDLEAFALLRAVGAPVAADARPDAAVVAVSVGHERTTLAVSEGNICQFTRVIEWGGSKLAAAIARDVAASPAEAAEMLLRLSLETGAADPSDAQAMAVREAVVRELQTLGRELVASLQFYQGQPGSLPFAEILLAGGTSRIPGLAAELERLTRVRVRLADPLVRVAVDDGIADRDDLASLAVAIGLGVED
jgi:type IV pilus assembly protein PilM